MSYKASAEYAVKDKLETMLTDIFNEIDAKQPIKNRRKKATVNFDIKTVLLGSILVMMLACVTATATCLMILR